LCMEIEETRNELLDKYDLKLIMNVNENGNVKVKIMNKRDT